MEKKDEYGIYLGRMPGKYPKRVQYCRVNSIMGHFWDLSPVFPRDRSQKWGKIRRARTPEKNPIFGVYSIVSALRNVTAAATIKRKLSQFPGNSTDL